MLSFGCMTHYHGKQEVTTTARGPGIPHHTSVVYRSPIAALCNSPSRGWLQGIPVKPSQHGWWIGTTVSLGPPWTCSRFTGKSLCRNYSVLLPWGEGCESSKFDELPKPFKFCYFSRLIIFPSCSRRECFKLEGVVIKQIDGKWLNHNITFKFLLFTYQQQTLSFNHLPPLPSPPTIAASPHG